MYIRTQFDDRIRIVTDKNKQGFIPNDEKFTSILKGDFGHLFAYQYETGAYEFYVDTKDYNALKGEWFNSVFNHMWDFIERKNLTKCETDPADEWNLWKEKTF